MTTDVLLKLLEAGYTKDEINLMQEVETKPAAPEQAVSDSDEVNPDTGSTAEPNAVENQSEKMTETINDIMQIITKMQKTLDGMQQKNAKNAESDQPARLTADDVVKNFFKDTKKA